VAADSIVVAVVEAVEVSVVETIAQVAEVDTEAEKTVAVETVADPVEVTKIILIYVKTVN
jgi:hypothetical protein